MILDDKQANLPVDNIQYPGYDFGGSREDLRKMGGPMASMLLDEMRNTMRRRHYSIRTEQSYCAWAKRYVLFHKMRSKDDYRNGKKKIEAFFTHLATDLHEVSLKGHSSMY